MNMSVETGTMDKQPVLKGELLELRPLRPEDFDALFAVASDPLIWEQHPEWNRYQEPVFREFFRVAIESGGALVAIDRATGVVIGSSRFHGFDPATGEVEVGWSFLARAYWGGRYNGEMKRLMLEHARRTAGGCGPGTHRRMDSQSVARFPGRHRFSVDRDGRGPDARRARAAPRGSRIMARPSRGSRLPGESSSRDGGGKNRDAPTPLARILPLRSRGAGGLSRLVPHHAHRLSRCAGR